LVNLREIDHLEDLGIDGRIINLKQKGWDDVDCMKLAQDSHKWWACVKAVMNLQFAQNVGSSWLVGELLPSPGIYST
jgi:hypothetical protein